MSNSRATHALRRSPTDFNILPVHPTPRQTRTEVNTMNKAAADVLAERRRQMESEGWTPEHDDEYLEGELVLAARCYCVADAGDAPPAVWPWARLWWKPKDRRRNIVRAAALLLAEIERLDRKASRTRPDGYPTWVCKTCDNPAFCVFIQGCDRAEMAR